MMTDTIATSIAAIEEKRAAQYRKQSADNLAKALERLDSVSTQLKNMLDCMEAITHTGISSVPILNAEFRDELLSSISACGEGAAKGTLTRETVRLLETQYASTKRDVDTRWPVLAKAYSEGLCGYLSILGSLTNDPKKAVALHTAISSAVTTNPTKKSVEAFNENVSEAQRLTSAFSLKPDIMAFLKKVKNLQATIADLTPEVTQWLEEKQLKEKLNVRF